MNVNVTAPIVDYDGNPAKQGRPGEEVEITVRHLIHESLNVQTSEGFDADRSMRIFDLSMKIREGDIVDLDEKERAFIQERAATVLYPMFYGRLRQHLVDPPAEPGAVPLAATVTAEPV